MKYIIEHMEQGFSEWVTLEYAQIIRDIGKDNLILSSLPEDTVDYDIPKKLREMGLQWTTANLDKINEAFPELPELKSQRVCLLDPRAKTDLIPSDAQNYD